MGEMADMMLSGVLCQVCGGYMEDEDWGFPRTCDDCQGDDQ